MEKQPTKGLRKRLISFLPLVTVLIVSITSHAQSISTVGLVDHFDPSSGLTTNEQGQVTGWVNQADNTRNIGTPDELRAKLLFSGDFPPMVEFESKWTSGWDYDGALTYSSPGSAALQDGYTVFAAVKLSDVLASSDPENNRYKRIWRGADDSHALYLDRDNGSAFLKSNPIASASRPKSNYNDVYAPEEIAILTARVTSDSQELYFNGALVDSRSVSVASYSIDNSTFEIGDGWDTGSIGHVLVYDNNASLADLDKTGAHLGDIYGVSWTPIPEPSTVALLFGLVAIGGAIVHRTRRT